MIERRRGVNLRHISLAGAHTFPENPKTQTRMTTPRDCISGIVTIVYPRDKSMGNSVSGLLTAVQDGDLEKLKGLTDANGKLRDVNCANEFG